ncbi:DUF2854 domain-containing protein [Almyronema epifaneia]|uniref:DUF2854 domain-containing protein n=1 Tax=Almyronema epifaneia S1 TaxID=2991925 RepID=A0ABW6IC79_9CYAN
MLRKIPLGAVLLSVGSVLTLVGFVAYFQERATLNLVGFFYGVPILLGGLALKAAELEPVPFSQPTTPEVEALRSQQATATQNQIRQDVTRYRYGQEAHLDESLARLGLSPNDEQRPVLIGIRETAIENAYALVLEFESPHLDLDTWQRKQDKIQRFFGPGVIAQLDQPAGDRIDLSLIASAD